PFFFSRHLPPPFSPLFPYTTLFRSHLDLKRVCEVFGPLSGTVQFLLRFSTTTGAAAIGFIFEFLSNFKLTIVESLFEHRAGGGRSEEHTSELQSRFDLVCRLLLEKK